MLVVTFLGYFVTWDRTISILWAGAAVAAVLFAVAYLLRHAIGRRGEADAEHDAQRVEDISA